MDRKKIEAAVLSRGWLAKQPKKVQRTFLSKARLRCYDKGETVYRIEDSVSGLFGIGFGACRFWVQLPNGRRTFIGILQSGVWTGARTHFAGGTRRSEIQALQPTWMYYVPAGDLREIAAADPEINDALASLGDANFMRAIRLVTDLLIPSTDQRVAASLLRAVGLDLDQVQPVLSDIAITQSEIAQMSNASRFSVNRALARFAESGWIRKGYNRLEVRDSRALHGSAYAGVGDESSKGF